MKVLVYSKTVGFNKIFGWGMCKLSKHDRQYLHRKWIKFGKTKKFDKD